MNSCTWYKSHADNFSSSIINTLVYFVYSAVLRFTLFQLFDRKLPKQWLCNLFLLRRRFRAAISDATCSCALELPNLFFLPPPPCRYLALLILCRVTKGYNTSRLTLGKVAGSSRHWHTDKNRARGKKKTFPHSQLWGIENRRLTLVIILPECGKKLVHPEGDPGRHEESM